MEITSLLLTCMPNKLQQFGSSLFSYEAFQVLYNSLHVLILHKRSVSDHGGKNKQTPELKSTQSLTKLSATGLSCVCPTLLVALAGAVQHCFTPTETIQTIRDGGEPRTATSTFTQRPGSDRYSSLLALMAGAAVVDWLLKTKFLPTTVCNSLLTTTLRHTSVQKGEKTSPCHDDRHTRQELWTPTRRSDRFILCHNTAESCCHIRPIVTKLVPTSFHHYWDTPADQKYTKCALILKKKKCCFCLKK